MGAVLVGGNASLEVTLVIFGVDSATCAGAAIHILVGLNGQLSQAVAANNTVGSFVDVLNALPLVLALVFYIDSTACTDAIYELVRLSAQHLFAVAADDLVGCFAVINNALPLVLALGFYIDSTACADAIYELVRLSAQNFFAIAANDLVGCFVVVCNALPLVLALNDFGIHLVTAGIAETIAVTVSAVQCNIQLLTALASHVVMALTIRYRLGVVTLVELIAAHVANTLAQILALAGGLVCATIARAGVSTVAIGNPSAALMIALGLGSHAALAHVACFSIKGLAITGIREFTTSLAEAAMGHITIGFPCAAFTGMVIRSKNSGGNTDNHNNNHQHCQHFLLHWFNKPPF